MPTEQTEQAARGVPYAIEVVGFPGSGKSSLARALGSGHPPWQLATLRSTGPRALAAGALAATPAFVSQVRRLQGKRLYRFSMMAQLATYGRWLDRQPADCRVVFDQGPVYLLGIVERARNGGGASQRFDAFWHSSLNRWAQALRMVVVLDAPASVLYERVQRRGTKHPMLSADLATARAWFDGARGRRDQLLRLLQEKGQLAVSRLDTEELSTDDIRDRVQALALGRV